MYTWCSSVLLHIYIQVSKCKYVSFCIGHLNSSRACVLLTQSIMLLGYWSFRTFFLFLQFSLVSLPHLCTVRLSFWFGKDNLHRKSCMSGFSSFYSESVKKLRSSYLSKSSVIIHLLFCSLLSICSVVATSVIGLVFLFELSF